MICDNMEYSSDHVLELVTKARILADQCEREVHVLCIGKYYSEMYETLIRYGTDNVIVCERDETNSIHMCSDIAAEVIKTFQPCVVLVPASSRGKGIAALLSAKLNAGLTADCIDVEIDADNTFAFSRAALNDSVIAKIKCINCNINMGTVKKGAFEKYLYSGKTRNQITKYEWTQKKTYPVVEVLESTKYEEEDVDISKYQVVFCIGRGVKSKETRDKIRKLADQLNAGVVVTRAVVEEYNISKARQVGQSGKSISPKIYIGLGVSGASQHMVGIKRAEIIVAVNHDVYAPIFDYADYSIVEDVEVFVDALEKEYNKY